MIRLVLREADLKEARETWKHLVNSNPETPKDAAGPKRTRRERLLKRAVNP
jgi:hypothetical protein